MRSYTPTIGELEAFCACARTGSATEAAARLNLSQSAVSRSVAGLEARLGVALFHRIRQRLHLSDAGRAFLPEAETVLARLDQAAVGVMAFGGSDSVLRVATLPGFGRAWLGPRLGRFALRCPNVVLDLTARLAPVDFARDPFDCALVRREQATGQITPLIAEKLVMVAAPQLVEAADLDQLPLLQQSTRPTLWLEWFRETGEDPRRILRGARFDHFDMVLEAAMAGLGLGLVPEVIARAPLAEGRLRLASENRLATGEDYVLATPEVDNPTVRAFRDFLLEEAAR
ncbi:LysR substrate-binding domain-containing protein [Phaeovulum vinaykumarii]|uniref:DNA-binding transcriptional regulator, LysR family n=1 Tax=Phaeovulum vinaykumarii TaxID=407234 RepID=A0A1N7MV94_9RHOB|nr:LysR substrate-binding domain-containing protein [Phaeovulum vinaykumarii]SIS89928.1 DNA-binding transcriptional regulator, LysR family [Phaeovulum vinaykumarii]SOC16940.1 DNA-binding transcriptional LysR family regulator [Phaeovulum vinaykumarii]